MTASSTEPRRLSITASGKRVAVRGAGGVEVVDVADGATRRWFALADDGDFVCAGDDLWRLERGLLQRDRLSGARVAATPSGRPSG